LFEEAKASQLEVDAAYKQRAEAYGADPSRVIVNRGQNEGLGKGQILTHPKHPGFSATEDK